jgi:hypothetical protein
MIGYSLTELFDKRNELAGEIIQAEGGQSNCAPTWRTLRRLSASCGPASICRRSCQSAWSTARATSNAAN